MDTSQPDLICTLRGPQAWDNYFSLESNPLHDLHDAICAVWPANLVEMPRHIWAQVQAHPEVMSAYENLRTIKTDKEPERCPTCGAMQQTFRPPLNPSVFELILSASLGSRGDAPSIKLEITDSTDNQVVVVGKDRKYGILGVLEQSRG